MDFTVKRNSIYMELAIEEGNATLTPGLLCDSERKDLAQDLLSVVYDLVYRDFAEPEDYMEFIKSGVL